MINTLYSDKLNACIAGDFAVQGFLLPLAQITSNPLLPQYFIYFGFYKTNNPTF